MSYSCTLDFHIMNVSQSISPGAYRRAGLLSSAGAGRLKGAAASKRFGYQYWLVLAGFSLFFMGRLSEILFLNQAHLQEGVNLSPGV